jgi:hypothetical protein
MVSVVSSHDCELVRADPDIRWIGSDMQCADHFRNSFFQLSTSDTGQTTKALPMLASAYDMPAVGDADAHIELSFSKGDCSMRLVFCLSFDFILTQQSVDERNGL